MLQPLGFLWLGAVFLCFCQRTARTYSRNTNARIVGGTTSNIGSVPYLVNLRKNGKFICGGTLVSETHVVTAAHCVKGVSASSLTVVGGATLLSDQGVRRSVQRVIVPQGYRSKNLNMDVAVLKLSGPLSGTNIRAIGLCQATWKTGDRIKVSGWGLTGENAKTSNHVKTVNVPVIAKSKCTQSYKGNVALTKTMFCASKPGLGDSCSGDSGGPAVFRDRLCGVVSWGIGCARREFPGVYTNVRTVKTFIANAMKQ